MKDSNTHTFLGRCQKILATFAVALTFMMCYQSVEAHGVRVGYCVLNNGFIRVWVEHWHGDAPPLSGSPLNINITSSSGTQNITVPATGRIANTEFNQLPGCGPGITILQSCPGQSNAYKDWLYWDFPPGACNTPIQIDILQGTTAVTTEACSQLYPQTISGLSIPDLNPPALTCPDVNVTSCSPVAVNYAYTVVDACDPNPTVTESIADGSTFNPGTTSVTITATDNLNQSSTCTFNVNVNPLPGGCNQPPVAVCQNVTVSANGSCQGSANASDFDGGSSDPNGDALSFSVNPSGPYNIGATNVTLTVSDGQASSSCSATINVVDTDAPNAVCQNLTLNLGPTGSVSISTSDVDGGSSDNCGIVSSSIDVSSFDCSDAGENHVTLTVTDAAGNSSTCIATVTVRTSLLAVSLSTSSYACGYGVSCNGATDGSVTSSVSGGCEPYSYAWSNNTNGANIGGVGAGSYTLVVTDANGNTATASATLTEPAPLGVSLSAATYNGGWNVSCNGATDGSIDATTTGGCGPYAYSWSNGSTVEDPGNLGAGSYTVNVTDQNGCTASASITLTEPPVLQVEAGPNAIVYVCYSPTECTDLTGMSNGGTMPYTSTWSDANGVIANGNTVTVCPTQSTVYYYETTDANGCYAIDSLIVCALDVCCTGTTNNGTGGTGQTGNGVNNGQGGGQGLIKITVCHIPAGNPANAMTKCLSPGAVAAHLAHGDYLGACGTNTFVCDFDTPNLRTTSSEAASGDSHLAMETYPNPTNSLLNVGLTCLDCGDLGKYNVKVVNLHGQILQQNTVEIVNGQGMTKFDISDLATGFYFVIVENGSQRLVEKVMKN